MNTLKIPCKTGEISDGYHTFDELYQHRCTLFLALMKMAPEKAWFSLLHDDGSKFDGWFVAGLSTPSGTVTYHLSLDLWPIACATKAKQLEKAPRWDGHTSSDVVKRIQSFVTDGWMDSFADWRNPNTSD